tara:strand:+ start:147 stop:1055 length:909 start_codon:yes stop_codon:yes gene_type:complete
MQEKYEKIVLDGANIIHDDTGIVMKDDEGKRLMQIRPERLLAAINHCESLGWSTIACLKEGTYNWAKRNPESETVGDVDLLDQLIQDGKVITIPAEEDDIYFIDYAIKVNGMIVTHDTFEDNKHKKDDSGNVIKRERSLYPDRNWDDIDQRTLRDFRFLDDKFVMPKLKQKGAPLPLTEKSTVTLEQIFAEIIELQKMVRKMQHTELKKQVESPKSSKQVDRSIANSIMDQLLSKGDKVHASVIQLEVARALLKLPKNQEEWPKKWSSKLKQRLGYSNFIAFAKVISKRKIRTNEMKTLLFY